LLTAKVSAEKSHLQRCARKKEINLLSRDGGHRDNFLFYVISIFGYFEIKKVNELIIEVGRRFSLV